VKLLLDVGNTAVKWACLTQGRLGMPECFVHRAGDIGMLADAAWSGLPPPDEVLIASVAGWEMEDVLSAWFMDKWEVLPVFLRSTASACGVVNAYSDPETLGIDRWAALVAAHHEYPGDVCVVDCGTAITLDMVTAQGEHRGGLIFPGIGAIQQTLSQNTALLGLSGKQQTATPLANTTRDGIYSGAVYLVVAAVERSVAAMCESEGASLDIVITGGDAERILPLLQGSVCHAADLVLRGVAMLAGEA
jgi:type III pantothenate kinase